MAPKFCCQCGKKPTRNRSLDPSTALCSACATGADIGNSTLEGDGHEDSSLITDDTTLSEVRFGDLKLWLQNELHTNIKQIVKEELKTEVEGIKRNFSALKSDVENNKTSTASNTSRLERLDTDITTLKESVKEDSAISKNNLKYSINLDRNERRQNVIIFGVPEDELKVGEVVASADIHKCNLLFQIMGIDEVCRNAVKEIFRLGKIDVGDTEKRRPLKVKFTSSAPASAALSAGQKLKQIEGQSIYVKPDKTKGEQEEFKRLGKRKEELLKEYNNDNTRVKLEKGVLYVDSVEVDRYKSMQTLF